MLTCYAWWERHQGEEWWKTWDHLNTGNGSRNLKPIYWVSSVLALDHQPATTRARFSLENQAPKPNTQIMILFNVSTSAYLDCLSGKSQKRWIFRYGHLGMFFPADGGQSCPHVSNEPENLTILTPLKKGFWPFWPLYKKRLPCLIVRLTIMAPSFWKQTRYKAGVHPRLQSATRQPPEGCRSWLPLRQFENLQRQRQRSITPFRKLHFWGQNYLGKPYFSEGPKPPLTEPPRLSEDLSSLTDWVQSEVRLEKE